VPAPLGTPPFFVRAGSAIAANVAEQHFAKPADERGFYVFPHKGTGSFVSSTFEDDGESFRYARGQFAVWNVAVGTTTDRIKVNVTRSGSFGSMPKQVRLIFPVSEQRKVEAANGRIVSEARSAEGRVVTLATGA
jgi:alpha-glucosidase